MLSRLISNVDGATRNATSCSVEPGIGMRGLEHVPIWENVQVTRQKRIVGIYEDMPGMRGRYPGKEVIRVAHHHAGLVERQLGMKQDLRDLRHARYGFYAEVAEGIYCPGILISFDES